MPKNKGNFKPLPWDSVFWGFPVAEYRASRFSSGEIQSALLRGQQEKKRCLFFFLPSNRIGTHRRLLQKKRIRLVEHRIVLARQMSRSSPCPIPKCLEPVKIRKAKQSDLPNIYQLARRIHRNTRFFQDQGFPRKRAALLYEKWIFKDFKFNRVFVAIPSRRGFCLGGYITCEILPGGVGRIGLLAVDPRIQGQGVGHQLVLVALHWLGRRSCIKVQVTTQAENQAALRLYQSTGFRQSRRESCFHWWSA